MKKTATKKLFWTFTIFIIIFRSYSQTIVNTETVTYHGSTDTAAYMPIQINTDGKVILSGNMKLSSSQYNAETSAQFPSAVLSWVNSFNPSTDKCFITASTHDATGFIYNVGAVRITSGSNGLDFFVQKLNTTGGVVWTKYYNGSASLTDVASAVAVDDATGDVYVTGATTNIYPDLIDMVTIKYDLNGNQMWTTSYDYADAFDIPTSMELMGGELTVAGYSGSSFTNNDLCVVRYDVNTGSQIDDLRTTNTNSGAQDVLTSMAADSLGNVYTVGRVLASGTNYNLQVQKLDTALNVLWTQTYDANGFEDVGINLDLDASLNIYVTGYSYLSSTNKQMTILKYANNGSLQWVKHPNNTGTSTSEGLRIKVKSSNEIFVGGNIITAGNQDMCMMRLDATGKTTINKFYDSPSALTDKFMDFTLDNSNHIFVSGRSYNGTDDDNIVVQYKYKDFGPSTLDTAGANGYKFVNGELIIQFDKKGLKMTAINNRELLFGNLNVFVNDSTCDKITDKLDHDGRFGISGRELSARKIFYFLTEADSLSQTRSGSYVKVPNYICYLLVDLPSQINLITANYQLSTVKPDIHSSELNKILEPQNANDPFYTSAQGSLHSITNYQNSNINCDSAWTITGGEPYVRVGVLDNGIDFQHPDYGGMPTAGYDFVNSIAANNVDDGDHGTAVSSIIAAVRNNNTGIAGIAGKDATGVSQGVTLLDCKVCEAFTCQTAIVAAGLAKAILGTNIGGYAVNIANLSIRLFYSYYNNFTYPGSELLIKALNDANRNGTALSISKGNLNNIGTYAFPADYSDEIIMSVGSTGRDGHHCVTGVNCDNASTTWGNIDFCAPGTDSLVYTLDYNSGYRQESGTSMATPHVSGATALMMSYRNKPFPHWDNLVHEDCEQMLQRTCIDLAQTATYNEKVGYDTVTGWGRINVTKVLKKIDKNYYRFRHITETIGSTSTTRSTFTKATNLTMAWPSFQTVPAGNYSTDIIELTSTINFVLLPSEVIIGYWPLNKECWGIKMDSSIVDLDRPFYSKIVSMSNTQAVLKTYYYKYNPNLLYFPDQPANIRQAFTLYTYDSTGTVGFAESINSQDKKFVTYPNPSTGEYNVLFNAENNSVVTYKVFNLLGQEVKTGSYTSVNGVNKMVLNLNDFTNGVYILNIFDKNKMVYKEKLIKN